jgi:hypothetical protein
MGLFVVPVGVYGLDVAFVDLCRLLLHISVVSHAEMRKSVYRKW